MIQEEHLRHLVEEYQQKIHLDDHLAFYQQISTVEEAIDYAALAKLPDGRKHRHQWRIPLHVLESVKQNLLSNKAQLEQSESFEDILHLVQACAVPRFGELARYDTALRLAVRLNKLPTAVYVHAGARKGATALGLNANRACIALAELPQPLQTLSPHQAEDFLCICKEKLANPFELDELDIHGCTPRAEESIEQLSPCIDVQPC